MHGLGNCYIYIDAFKHQLDDKHFPQLAKQLSNVNTGIGSDGLIVIGPSSKASLKMRIFNKDGSEGKNCGNGLRCVAKYAFEEGLIASKSMTIETLGGIVDATITHQEGSDTFVKINMGEPKLRRKDIPMQGQPNEEVIREPFEISGRGLSLTAVSMGNPHAVFFVPTIAQSLHKTLGKKIEKDPRFPDGINVEFVSVVSPTLIHCRVWERGSGITAACGTGACAVTVASILNGLSKRDEEITIRLEGGDLKINWTKNGDVLMTGPATNIATGTFTF